jgi:hypothetical protein
VIVYAGTWAVAQRDELVLLGASDVMANREQLINTVLRMLGRAPEEPAYGLSRWIVPPFQACDQACCR